MFIYQFGIRIEKKIIFRRTTLVKINRGILIINVIEPVYLKSIEYHLKNCNWLDNSMRQLIITYNVYNIYILPIFS